MSLSRDGVWKAGVWATTVWESGVWYESPGVSVSVTRTTGVEPLGVRFDASSTTSDGTTNPIHDLHFTWDFGAGITGNWATTGNPKRYAYGPIAACVFPAGSHAVTLTVLDDTSGTRVTYNVSAGTISVTAADTFWDTTKTVVVSTAGDFTGAPSGATQVTSSDFDSVLTTHKTDNSGQVRILFRDDETFAASAGTNMNQTGPWMLGSFGGGSARPIVNVAAGVVTLDVSGTDGRITDMTFDGGSDTGVIGTRFLLGNSQTTIDGMT